MLSQYCIDSGILLQSCALSRRRVPSRGRRGPGRRYIDKNYLCNLEGPSDRFDTAAHSCRYADG